MGKFCARSFLHKDCGQGIGSGEIPFLSITIQSIHEEITHEE
jgi:hypothetical protein